MPKKVRKTEKQWEETLTPEQFLVLRQGRTEQPFSGKYDDFWAPGLYVCAACRTPLFRSETKYDHGTGWPSFASPVEEKNLVFKDDYSLLMKRVEVRCAACGSHLGHVFDDGPAPTYLHYCINSVALEFVPASPTVARSEGAGMTPPRPAGEDGSGAAGKGGMGGAG
jgi:peptide-methionine (R)-S-oxide reductase